MVGAAIFHRLAEQGIEVTLVERDRVGMGTTAWSGGIVRCYHDHPTLVDRALVGWEFFQAFAERTGEQIPFTECGFLYLPTPERGEHARKETERIAATAPAEWLESSELERRFGHLLTGPAHGAVWEPRSGYLNAVQVVRGYVRAGRRHGGKVIEGVEARSFGLPNGDSGIRTSAGAIRAESVVLAAGAASPRLLDSWGVRHDLWTRPIQVDLRLPPETPVGHPAYMDDVHDINGRPDPESGGIFLGHSVREHPCEPVGGHRADPAHTRAAAAAGAQRLRWVRGSDPCGGLRADECHSPDPLGRVFRIPGPMDLLLATGFNGGGFKMAPWAAEKISRLLTVENTNQMGTETNRTVR